MKYKGSMTVFLSLILTIILALVSASILSVKVAAGRAQIANGMNQAMYSLFARFDRDLEERYHLFFFDGGYRGQTLQPGKMLDMVEEDMSYILAPNKESLLGGSNLLQLEQAGAGITGYTLATSLDNSVWKKQAVEYMKKAIGIQGIQGLLERTLKNQIITKEQEEASGAVKSGEAIDQYEGLQEAAKEAETAPSTEETVDQEVTDVPKDFVNPLDTIQTLKKTSILQLVVKDKSQISGKKTDTSQFMSQRSVEPGMGYMEEDAEINSTLNDMLFQEYLLEFCGNYLEPTREAGLAYQAEYILQGKDNDMGNLEGVVNKLLLMREAANTVFLYTDPARKGEAASIAATISTLLLMPEAAPVLEGILILAWAYAESLLDVRGLLAGKKVPLVKSTASWQLSLRNIPTMLTDMDALCKDNSSGMTYKDYLRVLLLLKSDAHKVSTCMDMIENTVQHIVGREQFRWDVCVESMEVEMQVRSEDRKTFTVTKRYGYNQ
ncbi:MAG: DUF5702 domain-containing protein [Lachnospiraceae bacterium]|nr:DUF5702 domain-containing protein [Lachnospiraceae bacterium]